MKIFIMKMLTEVQNVNISNVHEPPNQNKCIFSGVFFQMYIQVPFPTPVTFLPEAATIMNSVDSPLFIHTQGQTHIHKIIWQTILSSVMFNIYITNM